MGKPGVGQEGLEVLGGEGHPGAVEGGEGRQEEEEALGLGEALRGQGDGEAEEGEDPHLVKGAEGVGEARRVVFLVEGGSQAWRGEEGRLDGEGQGEAQEDPEGGLFLEGVGEEVLQEEGGAAREEPGPEDGGEHGQGAHQGEEDEGVEGPRPPLPP